MGNRKGLTLVESLVVVSVVLFLLAILLPVSVHRGCKIPVPVCVGNLHGLGIAMSIYANDYDGGYPQLAGKGPWSKRLGFDYDMEAADLGPGGAEEYNSRTITASWYMLVREADVSPKLFVCPESSQVEFDGANRGNRDIMELWDFGGEPHKHVSYVMHNPYGKYPADETRGAGFAIAADMSPWFADGDIVGPGAKDGVPQIIKADDETTWKLGNSWNHPEYRKKLFKYRPVAGTRKGQFVLFVDGHIGFKKAPNVGVEQDNIYTFWAGDDEQGRQGGTNPAARDKENDAKSADDSFLVL